MAYSARIVADSLSPDNVRLTTFEITYPRLVHSELMTHRMFSRNSASSRAIPVSKMIEKIKNDPVLPVWWGKNQAGMQAKEEFNKEEQDELVKQWLNARDNAVCTAEAFLKKGVHKQLANRILEPWMWITVLLTATEFSNFFGLRRHPDAQPEIKKAADLMFKAMEDSIPLELDYGQWHLPLVNDYAQLVQDGFSLEDIKSISVGRCARVSYLTHDGIRDPKADIELAVRLRASGHMSPYEHVARPVEDKDTQFDEWDLTEDERTMKRKSNFYYGNFRGFVQFRKELPFEDDYSKILANNGIQND